MSYILDALKKSEEKRRREHDASQLYPARAIPPAARPTNSSPALWFMVLLIPVILTAGYFIYKMISLPQPEITELPSIEAPSPTPEELSSDIREEAVPELKPTKSKVPAASGRQRSEVVLQPAPIEIEPLQEVNPQADMAGELLSVVQPGHEVPYLQELDAAFRDALPEFKLTGHVFSPDPKLRMIMINSVIVRERDVVEKQFILDEIIPDGVILRSGEIRFRLETN